MPAHLGALRSPIAMAGTFTDGKEGSCLGYAAHDASGVLGPFRFTRCVPAARRDAAAAAAAALRAIHARSSWEQRR